jgi:hypothetical protein
MLLLKIILGIILFYYLFLLFFRYIVPYLLKRHIRKTQEKYYGSGPDVNNKEKKKEGNVNIDYVPGKEKKNAKNKGDDLGEFVDYEEIED